MLTASSEGDLETMKDLASREPALVRCEYNYTPPIHFAVREGHAPVVSWLIEQGLDLSYRSYSFKDALLQMAREREYHDILQILEDARRIESATTGWNCCRLPAAATSSALTNCSQKHRSWSTPATTRGETALHAACYGNTWLPCACCWTREPPSMHSVPMVTVGSIRRYSRTTTNCPVHWPSPGICSDKEQSTTSSSPPRSPTVLR